MVGGVFDAHKALSKVKELEDRFDKIQRDFKALELDWASAYDKQLRLMQRIAKRHEAVIKAEDARTAQEAGSELTEASLPASLSPRQRLIQAQLMQRRAANGGSTR